MKLAFLANAKLDLLEGIEWFESISEGLGDQFEFEFFKCVDRIKNGPLNFTQNESGFRACRLKRFTAVVYFRVDGDRIVIVRLLVNGKQARSVEDA
jgi:hypothetical protein